MSEPLAYYIAENNTDYDYSSTDIEIHNEIQTSYWLIDSYKYKEPPTGISAIKEYYKAIIYRDHSEFTKDKILINARISFENQLTLCLQFFESKNINSKYLQYFFDKSVQEILQTNPNYLSVELTYDLSIFYTVTKNGIKAYVEFFLLDESDEDNAILTITDVNGNVNSYSGSITQILKKYIQKFERTSQTMSSFLVWTEVSQKTITKA